jgi:hypothetical protein
VTTASPVDGGRIHFPDPSGIESGPATIFPDRLKDPDFRVEEKPAITSRSFPRNAPSPPAAFPATRHHLPQLSPQRGTTSRSFPRNAPSPGVLGFRGKRQKKFEEISWDSF